MIIDGYLIETKVYDILLELKSQLTNGKLDVIENKGEYVRVTCPFHKDGKEHRPSCSVSDNSELETGYFHCFTCGEKGDFVKFISACLESSYKEAKWWLIKNFGKKLENNIYIEPCVVSKKQTNKEQVIDDSFLDKLDSWHPYLEKRKLSKDICQRFEVKYDDGYILFPVRDLQGNLIGVTKRSVKSKFFVLPKFNNKPVYLLPYVDSTKSVCVCESQINALYLWSLGYQAIALFGTGTTYQYNQLNHSGIKSYILCFDGDNAGRNGERRFKENIKSNCFIDIVHIPEGKDINDLSNEEVKNLLEDYYR